MEPFRSVKERFDWWTNLCGLCFFATHRGIVAPSLLVCQPRFEPSASVWDLSVHTGSGGGVPTAPEPVTPGTRSQDILSMHESCCDGFHSYIYIPFARRVSGWKKGMSNDAMYKLFNLRRRARWHGVHEKLFRHPIITRVANQLLHLKNPRMKNSRRYSYLEGGSTYPYVGWPTRLLSDIFGQTFW